MKPATVILLLALVPATLAGEISVTIVNVLQTNAQTGKVYGKEVFKRNGETNLVRITKGDAPTSISRIYHFYHSGQLVANFISGSNRSGSIFNTEAGPYCVSLRFGASGEIQGLQIGDEKGVLLDHFASSNGIFSPIPGPLVLDGRVKPQFGSQPSTHKSE